MSFPQVGCLDHAALQVCQTSLRRSKSHPLPLVGKVGSHQREVFFLYARQKTRSESDAKDILQDTLTEAWRKTKGVIPDKALVFKTIQRRAIDLGRSMDRRSKRENNFEGVKAHWFSPDYTVGDTRQHLAEAVQKLPGNLREGLVLRIWGDLSFPEIAELNRIPLATANSRYRYALERLRENEKLNELRP